MHYRNPAGDDSHRHHIRLRTVQEAADTWDAPIAVLDRGGDPSMLEVDETRGDNEYLVMVGVRYVHHPVDILVRTVRPPSDPAPRVLDYSVEALLAEAVLALAARPPGDLDLALNLLHSDHHHLRLRVGDQLVRATAITNGGITAAAVDYGPCRVVIAGPTSDITTTHGLRFVRQTGVVGTVA